jgi:hypothetical protein
MLQVSATGVSVVFFWVALIVPIFLTAIITTIIADNNCPFMELLY